MELLVSADSLEPYSMNCSGSPRGGIAVSACLFRICRAGSSRSSRCRILPTFVLGSDSRNSRPPAPCSRSVWPLQYCGSLLAVSADPCARRSSLTRLAGLRPECHRGDFEHARHLR